MSIITSLDLSASSPADSPQEAVHPATAPERVKNFPDPARTTSPFAASPVGRTRTVTREMVQARTRELAVLAGRPALAITQADYERARRELTGETEMSRQEAVLNTADAAGNPGPVAVAAWENEGGKTGPNPSPGPNQPTAARGVPAGAH